MISVNLVTEDNGVGISRDTHLLAQVLKEVGCTVSVMVMDQRARRRRRATSVRWRVHARRWWQGWRKKTPATARFDLNIMLEHLWPEAMQLARSNIALPNPEWFDRYDRRFLYAIDQVWAKTRNTQSIFQALHKSVAFTGFDSEDRYDPEVQRAPCFFHLAGKSPLKGTARLLALWHRHPEWPRLTVVQSRDSAAPPVAAANILYRDRYLDDSELRQLQNLHQFHLCTSESEGWGHYIVEAMSVGAVTIATAAPPMNELVTAERGLLVPFASVTQHELASAYQIGDQQLEQAIEAALKLGTGERHHIGVAARHWFVDNKRGFAARIAKALGDVPVRGLT